MTDEQSIIIMNRLITQGVPYDNGACVFDNPLSTDEKQALEHAVKALERQIDKLEEETESDFPERFTSTDCSCLTCGNRHSIHCEPQNKKKYGYCGNWFRK